MLKITQAGLDRAREEVRRNAVENLTDCLLREYPQAGIARGELAAQATRPSAPGSAAGCKRCAMPKAPHGDNRAMGGFFGTVSEVLKVAQQVRDWGVSAAHEAVARSTVAAARTATRAAVADPERAARLRGALDKRERFEGAVCQECEAAAGGRHPDPRDGQYMGADCPATQAERPAQGVKPDCAAQHPEKTFPKAVYTNGINNDAPTVCATMHALANNRCVEVVGIFNATYADQSLTGPDRQWKDYRAAAGMGLVGAALAGAPGALAGVPAAGLQEISRLGMVQDVLDCLDTIEGTGSDAATAP